VNGEQQRIAMTVQTAFSDSVDTHITAGLSLQPTRFTTTNLS